MGSYKTVNRVSLWVVIRYIVLCFSFSFFVFKTLSLFSNMTLQKEWFYEGISNTFTVFIE